MDAFSYSCTIMIFIDNYILFAVTEASNNEKVQLKRIEIDQTIHNNWIDNCNTLLSYFETWSEKMCLLKMGWAKI